MGMAKLARAVMVALSLWAAVTPGQALANTQATALQYSPEDYLVGAWWLYKSRFLEDGRIIDRANGDVSHSEGQGYGMLLAVAVDDRAAFDQMWTWTQRELYVRKDELAAWKWDPHATGHVLDRNNASDGDLLIAWALARAGKKWGEPDLTLRARRIADAIADMLVIKDSRYGMILIPAAAGFGSADRPDGPVVNLSYWIFPAIAELGELGGKLPASELLESGMTLLSKARFGASDLPSDWLSLADKAPSPAVGFTPNFGYEAIRLPLYAAWSGPKVSQLLTPVHKRWNRDGRNLVQVVDVATGEAIAAMPDPGYRSIGELLSCSLGERSDPAVITGFQLSDYYPSTLHLLTILALSEKYPSCLPNLN